MNDISTKRKEYLDYINKHIDTVKEMFNLYGEYLCEKLYIDIDKLSMLVYKHDKSKFSEEEFEPYRKHFYPSVGEECSEDDFDKAWEHHKNNNPHHEDYWHDRNMFMPNIYIAEMLLDWAAMSRQFNNSIVEFYNKNKTNKGFSSKECEIIESVIYKMDT